MNYNLFGHIDFYYIPFNSYAVQAITFLIEFIVI